MSLIIEDKSKLDSLANAIINSNKSVNLEGATLNELSQIIYNIIPHSACFSSGTYLPETKISSDNMPEIPFNLGTDSDGNTIVPDLILIYQPQSLIDGSTVDDCSLITILCPKLVRIPDEQLSTGISLYKQSTGNRVTATIYGGNYQITRITDTSFFLFPSIKTSWKANLPIVWMQIKL